MAVTTQLCSHQTIGPMMRRTSMKIGENTKAPLTAKFTEEISQPPTPIAQFLRMENFWTMAPLRDT